MDKTILGIDPGTKEMGYAIVRGNQLLSYGVQTLRNGARPYDVIGQARSKILRLIGQHCPEVVAIEKPYLLPTKRAALLSVITQELHERSVELGLKVVELSPEEVRGAVVGNPRATKFEIAHVLSRGEFKQLAPLIPVKPVSAALGWRPKDKYWLHMFDALALAVAAASRKGDGDPGSVRDLGGLSVPSAAGPGRS